MLEAETEKVKAATDRNKNNFFIVYVFKLFILNYQQMYQLNFNFKMIT
jgi:hypothetical protein